MPANSMGFILKYHQLFHNLQKAVFMLNQDELHEGDYVRYDREYVSDFEAYTNRETNILQWKPTMKSKVWVIPTMPFGFQYAVCT